MLLADPGSSSTKPSCIDRLGEGQGRYQFWISNPIIVAEIQDAICKIGWGQTRKVGTNARPRLNRTILNVTAATLIADGTLYEFELANGGSLITADGIVVGSV